MGGQLHGIFPKSVLLRFVFCLKIRALLGKLFPRVCRGTSHGTVKQRTVATEKARHRWSWGLRMYGCVARGGGSPSRGRKSRRKRLKISGHLGGGGGEMSNEQNQEPEAIGARRGLKQQSRGRGCMDASREALDHLCVAESRGAGVGGCLQMCGKRIKSHLGLGGGSERRWGVNRLRDGQTRAGREHMPGTTGAAHTRDKRPSIAPRIEPHPVSGQARRSDVTAQRWNDRGA